MYDTANKENRGSRCIDLNAFLVYNDGVIRQGKDLFLMADYPALG